MRPFSSPIRSCSILLSTLLVWSTAAVSPALAQTRVGIADLVAAGAPRIVRPELARMLAPSPTARRIRQAPMFRIVVVRGDGAINNISQRTAGEPIVAVRDENDNPVAGVAVTFLLPDEGAGGAFAGGENSMTVVTDANGEAAATGLTPNTVAGQFTIQVSATVQQQLLTATITQTNALTGAVAGAAAAGISTKLIVALAAIGGAVAAGTVVAFSGNGGDNGSPGGVPPVVIQTGSPAVGPPPQ